LASGLFPWKEGMISAAGRSRRSMRLLLGAAFVFAGIAHCTADGPKQLGDLCASDGECASGRCAEFLCKAADPAALGGPCANHLDCRSERCVDDRCVRGVRAPGVSCAHPEQCLGGRCSDGVCGGSAGDGGAPIEGGMPAEGGVDADLGGPTGPGWCRRIGGPGDDAVHGLALDPAGNLYVLGDFVGAVDFDGKVMTSQGGFYEDVYLASYALDGAHRWSRQYVSSGADYPAGVVADRSGNVYLATVLCSINYTQDLIVASVRGDTGAERWSKRIPWDHAGSFGREVYHLAVGPSGSLTLGGLFGGTVDFGGGPWQTVDPGGDLFLVALEATSGVHRWSHTDIGGPAGLGEQTSDAVRGGAEDPGGNLFVVGQFGSRGVDLGGGVLTGAGGTDTFLASYAPDGTHRRSRVFGTTYDDAGVELAVGRDGRIYVAAVVHGPSDLGGGPLPHHGAIDVALACYTADGEHLWSQQLGGPDDDVVDTLALDAQDNLYLGGYHYDVIDLGGGELPHAGGADAFFASYTAAGVHRWSRAHGSASQDYVMRLAVDPRGTVFVGGGFSESVDFGCGAPLVSAGGHDGFLIRMEPR
jgi:hypothetical protein